MKNTLHPGDLFIIDEPAAMLHPIAQKEVMLELLKLQTNGIKVVYSTHSPYLVPNDWNSVHFVTMDRHGTAVTQENCNDFLKQVIGGDIFNLQEILKKYQKGDKEANALLASSICSVECSLSSSSSNSWTSLNMFPVPSP